MNARTHQSQFRLRLLAGWCGLLLYLGALSPVGMGAVALLGAIDPDHQVFFQADAEGARLLLHHEARCTGHHHGTLARVLTLFAQPASNNNPDHVLHFGAATGVKRDSQVILPPANQSGFTYVVFAEPIAICAPRPLYFSAVPRPPPDVCGHLLALRTTALLI